MSKSFSYTNKTATLWPRDFFPFHELKKKKSVHLQVENSKHKPSENCLPHSSPYLAIIVSFQCVFQWQSLYK